MNNSIWNFAEADLGVLVKTKLNMNKQCAPATKTANDELCCTKHPLLFSSGETTGVQCPVLDSLVQEKHGESPVKRHEDSKGTGASLLWAQAERAATLAWRRSRRIFLMDIYFWRKGANRTEPGSFSVLLGDSTRVNGHKLEHRIFHSNIRKHFSLWGWLNPATGCPGSLWSLHPWQIQKQSEHTPWQADLSGSTWSGGLDQMTSRVPFQSQTFCGSMPL